MRFRPLASSDAKDVMELFCRCFADDHYYAAMFPDKSTRARDMYTEFYPTIEYCIEQGISYGIMEEDAVIAFILCFDYGKAKNDDYTSFHKVFGNSDPSSPLPNSRSFHDVVSSLSGDSIYCLSLAVDPRYQRMGIGAALVDHILEEYDGYNFFSDVSNVKSLSIYKTRNFEISEISEGYYLVIHKRGTLSNTFCIGETIKVVLPDPGILHAYSINGEMISEAHFLIGYTIKSDFGVSYFVRERDSVCKGCLAALQYDDYLKLQRALNIAQYEDHDYADYVLFCQQVQYIARPLLNDSLEEMLLTREREWSVIPDVYISIPVKYDPGFDLHTCAAQDSRADTLLRILDFRTNYEAGIPLTDEDVDARAGFKKRIERLYLGKVWAQIISESTESTYEELGVPVGSPALLDLYICLDKQSSCAVVTLFSLSCPFLLSHLLDNVCRNQLILISDGEQINLYDHLKEKYHLLKRGTAKCFVVIPKAKDCLSDDQIASLLAGETIYPEGESFGKIIDAHIIDAVRSEFGMGQYDRAFFCAYTNVALQFSPGFMGTIHDRMFEESITLFYIELILFEEASIQIADCNIVKLFTEEEIEPIKFLSKVDEIISSYSRTIDFWDIKVNYPTSQLSIDVLRKAFGLKEQLECLQRDQLQLRTVFDTKCDIVDRKDARRVDTSLAIISVLAVFSAWNDSSDFIERYGHLLSGSVRNILLLAMFILILIAAVYVTVHLFGNKAASFLRAWRAERHRRERKKKDKDRRL